MVTKDPARAAASRAAREKVDAELLHLRELVVEMDWLLENSRCHFTHPDLRAQWIVRKQKARRAAQEVPHDHQLALG